MSFSTPSQVHQPGLCSNMLRVYWRLGCLCLLRCHIARCDAAALLVIKRMGEEA